MENQPILARISIGIHEEGDKGFIYDFNTLKSFKAEMNDKMIHLCVDSEFEFNEKKYKVTGIETIFYDHLKQKALHQAGVNIYGIDEIQDYNIEIMYFVEELVANSVPKKV